MMQKNVGTYDAMLRITCGLVGLAWSATRPKFPTTVAILSALKVAEGVVGYCPLMGIMEKSTVCKESSEEIDFYGIPNIVVPPQKGE